MSTQLSTTPFAKLQMTPNGLVEVAEFDTKDGIYDCAWSEVEHLVSSAVQDCILHYSCYVLPSAIPCTARAHKPNTMHCANYETLVLCKGKREHPGVFVWGWEHQGVGCGSTSSCKPHQEHARAHQRGQSKSGISLTYTLASCLDATWCCTTSPHTYIPTATSLHDSDPETER